MLRYARSYRSVFNGPRWGAVLAVLLLAFAQATAAFHDPARAAHTHAHAAAAVTGTADLCCDGVADCAASAAGKTHAPTVASDCNGCDDCGNDCASEDCDSCCRQLPVNSPLCVPATGAASACSPFVCSQAAALLNKDLPSPFQPPRA